jgi:hypothetical protein
VRRFTGQLPRKKLPGEAWAGQPYAGQRLVLVVEQGFGDTLWVRVIWRGSRRSAASW